MRNASLVLGTLLAVTGAANFGCKKKINEEPGGTEEPRYTLKYASYLPGTKVHVSSSQSLIVKLIGKTASEDKTQELRSGKSEYVEQVLSEVDGKPTKLCRSYWIAQSGTRDLPYAGKVVAIEIRDDLPVFSLNGRVINKNELKELDENIIGSGDQSIAWMLPGHPVKASESWNVEEGRLREHLRGRESPIDVGKSSFSFKLAKTYTGADGKTWGLLEGTVLLTMTIPVEDANAELGAFTGTITIEMPVNSQSPEFALNFHLNASFKETTRGRITHGSFDLTGTQTAKVEEDKDDVRNILPLLKDSDASKRLAATQRLIALPNGTKSAVTELFILLDDKDSRVQSAAAEALKRLTSPSAADIDSINTALDKGRANARAYALHFYADGPPRKLPEHLLPKVISALNEPVADARLAAVRVLARYGLGCKSRALAAIFERTVDDDPTVAAEASRFFATFSPFDESERLALVARLTHDKSAIRLAAVTILAIDVPDTTHAVAWFRPRTIDSEWQIRAKSIEALAKWGPMIRECLPDIQSRLDDEATPVVLAAIKGVARIDSGPRTVRDLSRFLGAKESRPEVRAAATEAILSFDLVDAELAIPILLGLMNSEDVNIRLTVLNKFSKLGKEAKPALKSIFACLSDDDSGMRLSALKIVAAFGQEAADAIPGVVSLLNEKEPEEVAVAAAETLAQLGKKSIEPLTKALNLKLPKEVLIRICKGLAGFGTDAAVAGPVLLGVAMKQVALREFLRNASKEQPWSPDPVADALIKVGSDAIVKQLVEMAGFQVQKSGGREQRIASKGDDVMYWAIMVMGSLNPESLTEKGKNQIATQLDILSAYAPSQFCKDAAKAQKTMFPLKK